MCLFVHNPIQYVYVGEQKLCLSCKEFSYQTIHIYIYIYKLCKSYTMFVIWVCVDV